MLVRIAESPPRNSSDIFVEFSATVVESYKRGRRITTFAPQIVKFKL